MATAYGLTFDSDVLAYINAVESTDGAKLENGVRNAYYSFIVGCKKDNIWKSIKASCILAGARTLNGALVPLVGSAPTNYNNNFVNGDYNRKTGLLGDGASKALDTNRSNSADPQDNKHISIYATSSQSRASTKYMAGSDTVGGGGSLLYSTSVGINMRINYGLPVTTVTLSDPITGFVGASRNNSETVNWRYLSIDYTDTNTSATSNSANIFIFTRTIAAISTASNARIAFYSIGQNVDLQKLDNRTSKLIQDLGKLNI